MFSIRKKKPEVVKKTKRQIFSESVRRAFFITLGAFITAIALETFLLPNNIIDGGIIGISMMIHHITDWNLGLVIFCINVPFILMALQTLGKKFVIHTFFATGMLAIATNVLDKYHVTEEPLLITVFGGIILGLGVGLILRNSACLDGTEIVSINLSRKFKVLSVGEILMCINFFIYLCAGRMFGWEKALFAILTYYIASRVIDTVLEGLDKSKSVRIVSEFYREIGDEIMKELDTSVTYMKAMGGYSRQEKILTYCVVNRFEMAKLKDIVHSIDPRAFLVTEDVHEVEGIRVKKHVG